MGGAASATLALNADVCFRRGLFMLSAPLIMGEILADLSRAVTYRLVQILGATSAAENVRRASVAVR